MPFLRGIVGIARPGGAWLLSLLLLSSLWAASAEAKPRASLVVDAKTGAVLQSSAPTARHYPASLTKMMTAYLVLDAVEAGRLSFSQKLTVSAAAARQPPTRLGLAEGRQITVLQALLAMLTRSANDASVVLAEAVAGSEEAFARQMTHWARNLGMLRTRFRNATGLPDPDQVTTARDMVILVLALMNDFPQHYHFLSAPAVTYGGRTLPAFNGWVRSYAGADGAKTGFTCGSGYNIAATARRDGRRLVAIVLGESSSARRNVALTRLMNDAFAGRVQPTEQAGLYLASLTTAPDTPAPFVLPNGTCGRTATLAPRLDQGKLEGWGILFGSFSTQSKARSVAVAQQKALNEVVGRNRAAVVKGARAGLTRYSSLLVGLEQGEAGEACKQVWAEKAFCQVLRPEALNNEKAIWR